MARPEPAGGAAQRPRPPRPLKVVSALLQVVTAGQDEARAGKDSPGLIAENFQPESSLSLELELQVECAREITASYVACRGLMTADGDSESAWQGTGSAGVT